MGESSSEATLQSECSLLREWLSVAGLDKTKIRDIAADAFTEQIHARFDSAKLDEDAAQLQAEPVWLRAMIGDARWRPLLYDICAANPSSVLLQAAVRALAQSEHAAEVQANASLDAVIGGASSMQTFLSSLAVHLNSLRQGQPGAQARLEGLTCVGEPDFLVAQMLLRAPAIASDPEVGGLAEQSAAAMASAATRAHGQPFRRLHLLACGLPKGAVITSALISILTADSVSSADAHTLDEQCAKGATTAALRDPGILRLLLHSVFDPLRPPRPGPREQLLRVLAHAAADAADVDGDGLVVDTVSAAASATAARREAALAALTRAQAICERNEVSEVGASVALLMRCATEEPAAACGALVWARRVLTTPQFSGARFNLVFLPPVLRLLVRIAHTHPGLQGEVCAVVHAVLVHEPPSDSEDVSSLTLVSMRRSLVDVLLWLLTEGCVFPVLGVLQEWLAHADLSLVRHLIASLLALCAPPYSPAFGRQILRMLKAPLTLEAHRGAEARTPLLAWAEQAGRTPGLEEDALEVADALSAES